MCNFVIALNIGNIIKQKLAMLLCEFIHEQANKYVSQALCQVYKQLNLWKALINIKMFFIC